MPRIIGENLAEHRAQKRARLFEALRDLLDEKGFESITLAEIAKRAQVGRTAIYNHFPDKESILLAYITEQTRSYAKDLAAELQQIDDPIVKIRRYIRRQLRLNSTIHVSAGIDLRHVVTPETAMELSAHAVIIEDILRTILREAMRQGKIIEQRTEPLVQLLHATLSLGIRETDPHGYAGMIIATEEFGLRALGAEVEPTSEAEYQELVKLAEADLSAQRTGSRPSVCPVNH
ncbi:hypothetical protein BK816_01305 [Boudabousia tangfeifanii]|uniref:HTH tetR-type domain-containing protein n=1 Tax=Boudabousia tangfeifanii TaxID=1912795 RepID=A0A1D9MIT7_9ACTO|nr:TetR/AcrR family transcriptional regulator [Boudabousia tangfeifanii]AOZ72099.1 hypothetical protein BK816_01305 [Boudabousia tangfeifanii]